MPSRKGYDTGPGPSQCFSARLHRSNYMQLLGGENGLLVRRKVSQRSHARAQTQVSEMLLWSFLVTSLSNHALQSVTTVPSIGGLLPLL